MSVSDPTVVTTTKDLFAALESLRADLKVEHDSALKFRELIAGAEKAQAVASAKYSERVKEVSRLASAVTSLRSKGGLAPADADAAAEQVAAMQCALTDIEDVRPSTGSIFVRAFLGQVNVKAWNSADRSKLRDEYNKFKDRTNIGFIIFPVIWILTSVYLRHKWRYTAWIHILTHVWLLYYYVSLSLRENILKVNGSHIRDWWIVHHYVSSIMSIAVLTWPADSKSWTNFTPLLTAYFMYQGFVQVFQARYQKARHYARMAMGKAAHMDVANTETLTEVHAGLYLIVVLVFIAQAWQVFLGATMIKMLYQTLDPGLPWYDFREEVQCFLLGALFIVLGVVNFVVTVQTLREKSRSARETVTRVPSKSPALLLELSAPGLISASNGVTSSSSSANFNLTPAGGSVLPGSSSNFNLSSGRHASQGDIGLTSPNFSLKSRAALSSPFLASSVAGGGASSSSTNIASASASSASSTSAPSSTSVSTSGAHRPSSTTGTSAATAASSPVVPSLTATNGNNKQLLGNGQQGLGLPLRMAASPPRLLRSSADASDADSTAVRAAAAAPPAALPSSSSPVRVPNFNLRSDAPPATTPAPATTTTTMQAAAGADAAAVAASPLLTLARPPPTLQLGSAGAIDARGAATGVPSSSSSSLPVHPASSIAADVAGDDGDVDAVSTRSSWRGGPNFNLESGGGGAAAASHYDLDRDDGGNAAAGGGGETTSTYGEVVGLRNRKGRAAAAAAAAPTSTSSSSSALLRPQETPTATSTFTAARGDLDATTAAADALAADGAGVDEDDDDGGIAPPQRLLGLPPVPTPGPGLLALPPSTSPSGALDS